MIPCRDIGSGGAGSTVVHALICSPLEQMEKRFDDLKQAVLSVRQQGEKK
jgi:hypothetical protein